MSTITVRGLDDDVKQKIRVRAAAHGRSMEAEVREILTEAVAVPSPVERTLGTWLVEQLGGLAGDDPSLFDVRQHDAPRAPDFPGMSSGATSDRPRHPHELVDRGEEQVRDDLDVVVERLTRAIPQDTSARVAVDGVGASGKTRFASSLAERIAGRPVVVAHADDFFNPPSVRHARGRNSPEGFWLDAYDLGALAAAVREPPGAPDDALVLVEGAFLHRDELVGLWDFSVFLDVPFAEAARRMSERDGLASDDPRHGRYEGAQRLYFAAARPWQRASLVIDATLPGVPRIIDPQASSAAT